MRLDDGAADRQSHTQAVGLGRLERLEQPVGDFGRYSATRIGDAHLDHAVAVSTRGLDRQQAPRRVLHRLDGVADEIEQDLLHLDAVGEHRGRARIEIEGHMHTLLLGADQGERACLLDELGQALDPVFGIAARHEAAQMPDDVAGAQGLFGGLADAVAEPLGEFGRLGPVEKPPAALEIVGDGGERLVELMGECGGHLAQRRVARYVGELGLQLLQPGLGLLPLGQIADEAGEVALPARPHLAHGQLHGEGGAVLALADDEAADADDAPLAGAQVALHVTVMLAAVGLRHQDVDVAARHLRRGIAELAFGGGTEGLDPGVFVDHDHGVGNRVENRLQVRFPRAERLHGGCLLAHAQLAPAGLSGPFRAASGSGASRRRGSVRPLPSSVLVARET